MLDQQFDVEAENRRRLERLRRMDAQQGQRMSSPMSNVAAQQGVGMSNIPPEQMQLLQNASPNFAAKVKAEQIAKPASQAGVQSQDSNLSGKLGAASTAINMSGISQQGGAAGIAGSTLSGAAAGAAISGGNPYGAAAGAGVGAISSVMGAREARKQRQRDAEARAQENIANIHQSEGVQKNQAISNIISGLRSAFLGK